MRATRHPVGSQEEGDGSTHTVLAPMHTDHMHPSSPPKNKNTNKKRKCNDTKASAACHHISRQLMPTSSALCGHHLTRGTQGWGRAVTVPVRTTGSGPTWPRHPRHCHAPRLLGPGLGCAGCGMSCMYPTRSPKPDGGGVRHGCATGATRVYHGCNKRATSVQASNKCAGVQHGCNKDVRV